MSIVARRRVELDTSFDDGSAGDSRATYLSGGDRIGGSEEITSRAQVRITGCGFRHKRLVPSIGQFGDWADPAVGASAPMSAGVRGWPVER